VARLARLTLADQAHYTVQRGHSGRPVFADEADRAAYLAALFEAAASEHVQVHAYALRDDEAELLVTPSAGGSVSRMVQALGRRYVSAYNRRHACSGTLWDGRFRCAVVEPGATRLDVLRLLDGRSPQPGATSAAARTGLLTDPRLVAPPEYWHLGNTPFEREQAYRELLSEPLSQASELALRKAALGGWIAGSPAFARRVSQALSRPALPRPRGRPAKTVP
jgi:putative transposase